MQSPTYQHYKHIGIVSDLPPEEVNPNAWTGCENFQFQDTASRRVGGYAQFADPLLGSGPIFALGIVIGTDAHWIYCTVDGIYVTNGVNHWDITPAAGLTTCEPGDWTGTILNGIPVLNNTIDAPVYWDLITANKCKTIPGWPTDARCKIIRAFKYHLFALNIRDALGSYPDTLWWSEGAEPGTLPQEWVPTPSNDAGDMILADTPGNILDGMALRDTFIVYKDFSTYALSYVAGQYVYTSQKLFLTTGIQSANCIVEVNGEHWVFTGTDVIRHDGQNYQSIIQDKVKHDLVGSVEPTKLKLPCVTARHRNQQIWVCIPTQGNSYLNKAYVINVLTGDVGIRDLPLVAYVARGVVNPVVGTSTTWDSDTASWNSDTTFWEQQTYSPTEDSLLMCDKDSNKLWNVDITNTADGQPLYARIERQSLPTNDNILHAFITRLIPRISGSVGDTLYISVGGQNAFDTPITWYPAQPFVIGTDVAVPVQVDGRLISVKFEGTTNNVWMIHSYKLEIVDQGLY